MNILSRHLRNIRLKTVKPYIKGSVLDIGCGGGDILRLPDCPICTYCGIDRNPKRIEQLRAEFPQYVFLVKDVDTEMFDLPETFETILLVAVIEHVFNQKHLLQEALKYLAPAGRIVITTPTPFGNDIIHSAGARLGVFARSAADDHIVVYNKKRLNILANEFRLTIVKYQPFELFCNQLVVMERRTR